MLDKLILDKRFQEIFEFLQDEKNNIDPFYVDQAGNNFIQLVLIAMSEQLKESYRPFQSRGTVYTQELEPLYAISKDLFNLIKDIFILLKKRRCLFSHKNLENKAALDILEAIKIPFFQKNLLDDLLVFLVKSLESETHCLLPGRKYVTDLSLFRDAKNPKKRVEIPDSFNLVKTSLSLHQLLASYEYHLNNFGLGLAAKNFAVAAMSFVVSSKRQSKSGDHGRRLVTIPVYFENLAVKVEEGKHSEKALLENLKKDMNSQLESVLVTKLLEDCGNQTGIKVYGAVLDFHSTREVCQDCGTYLREFQTDFSSEGFISLLVGQLKRKGFVVSEKKPQPISLVVRASGLDNPSWSGRPDPLVVLPMFYAGDELDRDIRHFSPGVLLHLPPMAHRGEEPEPPCGKRYYSDLLRTSDSEQMDSERKRQRLSTRVDVFPFSIGLFTAFANGGGRAKNEAATAGLSRELIDLPDSELAKVMSV